jgi:excisionase family DNA binding protein
MTRRSSPQRASAAIVASERHESRQPIGRSGTIAESADMPSTLAQIGEALMERRAPDSPRRDCAQISVGRRHGMRKPFGRLRTIDEIAEILNVSSRTVRRLIDSGALPVHRIGRSVRISDADIAQLLAASRDE